MKIKEDIQKFSLHDFQSVQNVFISETLFSLTYIDIGKYSLLAVTAILIPVSAKIFKSMHPYYHYISEPEIVIFFLNMFLSQDTVVALQALALYATLVFSPEGSSTVTVQSPSGQLIFDVNRDNKLLYQEVVLKDVTGKHSLEVKGTACSSVQVSHH